MTDPDVVRGNARINAVSGLLLNLSGALVAADAYRVFVQAIIDLATGFWTLVAMALIFAGLTILSLLEADDQL